MFEYRQARPDEYEKCLNFGNYVFSQAHCPHDFRALLPKTYKNQENFSEVPHFIAMRDDGEIRGLVALRDTPLKFNSERLECGFVGTVSVHPYARGEGHMKANMAAMLDYAAKKPYDILVLGGQRQRYNYFGFDNGGAMMRYHISSTNLRHKLKDVNADGITFTEITEENGADYAYQLYSKEQTIGIRARKGFVDVLHSWTGKAWLIVDNGTPIGYFVDPDRELVLEDEEQLPRFLKAWFSAFALKSMDLWCGLHEARRREMLSSICEGSSVCPFEMINVLNWVKVLNVLLKYKAAYVRLEDGVRTLVIEGKPITITVKDGVPFVTEGGNADGAPAYGHLEAQNLFFGLENVFAPKSGLPVGWTGIPFFMSTVDGF